MPKYERFEELPVWREAAKLYNRVLDLLEQNHALFSSAFRNQLERAALSISNNIAEGFERETTGELTAFLAIARGSAGEVRSMLTVISGRPSLKSVTRQLQEIRSLSESCARQITAWAGFVHKSPIKGKRHLTQELKEIRQASGIAQEYRVRFLRNLKPEHPLYSSSEARAARGEK